MLKSPGKIRILNIGDVHLGHARTPTEFILKNLRTTICSPSILKEIDLVTIAGDFFDKCLSYSDPQVAEIEQWITQFLWLCATHKVVLRVLEGTPSHDWKQSSFFAQQAKNANIPVDVRHVTELSIEEHTGLGVSILYVPDKWRPTTTETWSEVQGLLHEHGLRQVDFAVMHGAFEYQLPEIVTEPAHDSKAYQDIVRYLIFIGHVHRSFVRDRIVPSGSFDRLVQGEEEPKGFHVAVVDLEEGTFTLTFHENKKAKIYKAVDLSGVDETTLWARLDHLVRSYPKRSAFSLRVGRDNTIAKVLKEIRGRYPEYEWDLVVEKTKKEKTEEMEKAMQANMIHLPDLTPDVIMSKVKTILHAKKMDTTLIESASIYLKDILDGRTT